ncbi:alpha/beta hydrolase [Loktanella agnita]
MRSSTVWLLSGLLLCLALSGCTRPQQIIVGTPAPNAQIETIYVVDHQVLSRSGGTGLPDRRDAPSYAIAKVAVPPGHTAGRVEYPHDPTRGFVMADYQQQERTAHLRAIADAPGDEIVIFIHGFNTTTPESIFRLAQMRYDFGATDPMIVFAWASAARAGAYIYDRDSVLYARDDLVALLDLLIRNDTRPVTLVAHSMGAQLVMESLRQLALAGEQRTLDRVSGLIFIAPDIDPDIFRRQAQVIGDRDEPYVLLVSESDKALRVASWLIGGRSKVGLVSGTDKLSGLNVVVLDLTTLADGSKRDHLVAVSAPAAIQLLRALIQPGARDNPEFSAFLRQLE